MEAENSSLRKIHFINMRLSISSWQKLASGIRSSKALQKLRFNRMNFERNHEQLEILIEAINKCQSIESIDLSCNELSDRYGSLIAGFVQAQIEMRDEYKWKSVLRIGRQPSVDIVNRGLKEFILHHNCLGENFMKSMASRIKEDDYLRFLDLRYNKLPQDMLMNFLKTINSNKYLVGLDIRGNIGYAQSAGIKRALSLFL